MILHVINTEKSTFRMAIANQDPKAISVGLFRKDFIDIWYSAAASKWKRIKICM